MLLLDANDEVERHPRSSVFVNAMQQVFDSTKHSVHNEIPIKFFVYKSNASCRFPFYYAMCHAFVLSRILLPGSVDQVVVRSDDNYSRPLPYYF
ncbi:hypothetical protein GBA52_021761 [Prunus armeniaca]|nr:hypothetical protein GBA52_021761 [Prunus armeniaca]